MFGQGTASLRTNGLKNADVIQLLHDGRFDRIEEHRQPATRSIFLHWLYKFGANCPKQLPDPGKVEIEMMTCKELRTDRYRNRMSQTYCVEYHYVKTGDFADPRFYRLRDPVTHAADADRVEWMLKDGANGIRIALGQMPSQRDLAQDVQSLIQGNECESPALKTFSENLLRYTQGTASTQVAAGETPGWIRKCKQNLPSILPGAGPERCECLHQTLSAVADRVDMNRVEDDFSRENFLVLTVSKVGLQDKVGACFR